MAITISEQCKCGGAFTVSSRNSVRAQTLYYAFTLQHEDCVTSQSDDAGEESCGDVFTQTQLAEPTTEPELVTGFQRVTW
jgi:hypothetical protein